ncbi:MAG: tetratricopeptide (TPR) repeat protein [Planctomycetota bacterium]|jgi:tetratricopeptide (TPR) repeat protein
MRLMRAIAATPAKAAPATLPPVQDSSPNKRTEEAPAPTELSPELREHMEQALALGETANVDNLLHAVQIKYGEAKLLTKALSEIIGAERKLAEPSTQDEESEEAKAEPNYSERCRNAWWIAGSVERRIGKFQEAEDHFKSLIAANASLRAKFEFASLLDARGRESTARKAYKELLKQLQGETESQGNDAATDALIDKIRLRLAFFSREKGDKLGTALVEFSADRDDSMKRRAAIVLGLLGAPNKALELYVVDDSEMGKMRSTSIFRQEARMTEWAIQADDGEKAQVHAWNAAITAKLGRDRNYAMTLLVEAYRLDDKIVDLIARFAAAQAAGDLTHEARSVWVELLREEGRIDEAIALFDSAGNTDETLIGKTADLAETTQRKLIEIYREDDRFEEMIAAYQERIAAEPTRLSWREGLSRFHLERGDQAAAEAVWSSFVDGEEDATSVFDEKTLLLGFSILSNLGLDDMAIASANRAIEARRGHLSACLSLFSLHQERGRLDLAEAALEQLAELAAPDEPARLDLAEAWERLGRLDKAVEVLEGVVEVRGAAESGEDLAMHLAWLYSEVDNEEQALKSWMELWTRIDALSRRRYVEDRLMTVASRLGSLADIAIELEEKLLAGTANERETGLLVRLYTKVGDPVSASEIIDEFLRTSGGDEVDALKEKARVYLSCTDFYHYERTVEALIVLDPDGKPDYLRQLAMSQLERGKPEDARDVLRQLKDLEGEGTDAAEFEAGVLALAGLRDDAILAYQKGIAGDPNRIESWLLLGNLLKETGQTQRAIRIFQHLAETAEKDDLFTIAIDGLLNLEAPPSTMSWAKRITLERIAGRNDKAYLYQLVADLAEASDDDKGVLIALESSLSIAGERRSSILRELVDRAAGSSDVWNQGQGGNKKKHLAFSRRLVGLGEIVPPDVFLNMGEVFLKADDPTAALRTFRMATDLPDQGAFDRQTGEIFESADYPEEALKTYQRVLVSEPTSSGLLVKIAEMHERLGQNKTAAELYVRGTELQLARQPSSSTKEEKSSTQSGSRRWWGARNIDDFDRYFTRNVTGVLSVLSIAEGQAMAQAQKDLVLSELRKELADLAADRTEPEPEGKEAPKETLSRFPRSFHRTDYVRRLAFTFDAPRIAHDLDLALIDEFFPEDEDLLPTLVRKRLKGGYVASARVLLDATARSKEETGPLRFLVGQGAEEELPKQVSIEETMRLILPLIIDGKTGDAAVLLGRTQIPKDTSEAQVQSLMAASMHIKNADLSLRFGRQWLLAMFESGANSWRLGPVLEELETILGPKEFRGICLLLANKATEDPEKGQALLEMLPNLQNKFEEPLITDEELRDLIDAKDDLGWGWGLAPVIMLLPEDQRTSALRSALPRIKATARSGFLLQMMTETKEPLGEALTEYFSGVFPESLVEADMQQISYSLGELGKLTVNLKAALAVCQAVLEKDPAQYGARTARIALLEKLGRLEEALALAPDDWKEVSGKDEWKARTAKRALQKLLIEHDFDTLLLCMEQNAGNDPQADLIERVQLLSQNDRPDQALEILEAALKEEPEHVPYWQAMLTLRKATRDRAGTVACYKKIIELEPDERKHQEYLMRYWQSQSNPIEALAVKENLPPKDEDDEEAGAKIPGLPGGFALPSGATIVFAGTTFTGGAKSSERNKKPSMKRVKELAEEGDEAAAGTMLRRLWRSFPKGISGRDRYGNISRASGTGHVPDWSWPAEETKEEKPEEEPKPLRGGFDSYEEYKKPEEKTVESSYMHLANYAFGVQEMEHLLRTRNTSALNSTSARKLMAGLLKSRIAASSPSAVRDGLIGELQANQAGKVQHAMLLQLFDDHPELLDADSAAVLEDLARTLQTTDLGPLRKLAQLHARRGTSDSAMRIYGWCAAKVKPLSNFSFRGEVDDRLDARDLLEEVKEILEGEQLLTVTEQILFSATSGGDRWDRGQNEIFILETWRDMVPAEQALERCATVLAQLSTTEFDAAPTRALAKGAVPLYLQVGDTERALMCLEIALAKFDRNLFGGVDYLWPDPERPGLLGNQDLKAFFPEDSSAYPNAHAWYSQVAQLLAEWLADERIGVADASRFSAFAALRLAQLGANEEAIAIIQTALAWEEVPGRSILFLTDAARLAGAEEIAFQAERALFDKHELLLERVQDLAAAVQKGEGPAAALAMTDDLIQFTQHDGLVDALIVAATELDDTDRLAQLKDLKARAGVARTRLKELKEAEEAAAKAKAEANK